MKKYFKLAVDNLKVVVRRFPIVLVSCAIAGVFGLLLVHEVFADEDIPAKILLCVFMFALTSLNAKIAYESHEKITKPIYAALLLAGACIAACFGLFLLNLDYQYTGVRYAAVMFALVMLFLAMPYLGKREGSDAFVSRVGWRLAITGLYTGVLIGGLCALFFAIQELLNVNLIDEIYGDTAIVVASLFTPMLFLTGVKQFESFSLSKLFKVLLVYIFMPLLLAYTAVVYAYLIMIVFNNFEMPSGIVGNLVLWYGLVGIWVLFLSKEYLKNGFGKFFNRFYPIASVAPLVTMFIALYLRINQYGFTENRYYSLIAGIWLFGMIVFYIITAFLKKRRNVIVLTSLVLVVLLTVIGPWSAGNVSLRSQMNRLEQVLEEDNVLVNGQIESADKISQQANDIARYIARNHGLNKVDFLSQEDLANFKTVRVESYDNTYRTFNEDYENVTEVSGYDFMVSLNYHEESADIADSLYYEHNEDGVIIIYLNNQQSLSIDLNRHYTDTIGSANELGGDATDFIVVEETQALKVKLILQTFTFYVRDDAVNIADYNGRLLIEVK